MARACVIQSLLDRGAVDIVGGSYVVNADSGRYADAIISRRRALSGGRAADIVGRSRQQGTCRKSVGAARPPTQTGRASIAPS